MAPLWKCTHLCLSNELKHNCWIVLVYLGWHQESKCDAILSCWVSLTDTLIFILRYGASKYAAFAGVLFRVRSVSSEPVLHQWCFCVSDAWLQTGFYANSSTDMIGKSIRATGNVEILMFRQKVSCRRVGLAQWWERSPPNSVSRVRFPDPASYVGWVCCWFSTLLREVFLRVLRYSPLLKNQHFQFQFDPGMHGHFIFRGK